MADNVCKGVKCMGCTSEGLCRWHNMEYGAQKLATACQSCWCKHKIAQPSVVSLHYLALIATRHHPPGLHCPHDSSQWPALPAVDSLGFRDSAIRIVATQQQHPPGLHCPHDSSQWPARPLAPRMYMGLLLHSPMDAQNEHSSSTSTQPAVVQHRTPS